MRYGKHVTTQRQTSLSRERQSDIQVSRINDTSRRGNLTFNVEADISIALMSSSDSNPSLNDDVNSAASNSKRAIDFLTLARGLKTTKRTGWVMREVPQVESVADHSWRTTLMAMMASQIVPGEVDVNKCIQMALVHDLAEAAVGDITPHCGVSDKEKHELELNAITNMTETLGGVLGGEQILKLWKEYEGGVTNEAKLVKDLDKLEMILQAQEYEEDGDNGKSLDQFFTSTRGKWNTEMGRQWAKEIEARRTIETRPKDETK